MKSKPIVKTVKCSWVCHAHFKPCEVRHGIEELRDFHYHILYSERDSNGGIHESICSNPGLIWRSNLNMHITFGGCTAFFFGFGIWALLSSDVRNFAVWYSYVLAGMMFAMGFMGVNVWYKEWMRRIRHIPLTLEDTIGLSR